MEESILGGRRLSRIDSSSIMLDSEVEQVLKNMQESETADQNEENKTEQILEDRLLTSIFSTSTAGTGNQCSVCECDAFIPNVWKPKTCANCQHNHFIQATQPTPEICRKKKQANTDYLPTIESYVSKHPFLESCIVSYGESIDDQRLVIVASLKSNIGPQEHEDAKQLKLNFGSGESDLMEQKNHLENAIIELEIRNQQLQEDKELCEEQSKQLQEELDKQTEKVQQMGNSLKNKEDELLFKEQELETKEATFNEKLLEASSNQDSEETEIALRESQERINEMKQKHEKRMKSLKAKQAKFRENHAQLTTLKKDIKQQTKELKARESALAIREKKVEAKEQKSDEKSKEEQQGLLRQTLEHWRAYASPQPKPARGRKNTIQTIESLEKRILPVKDWIPDTGPELFQEPLSDTLSLEYPENDVFYYRDNFLKLPSEYTEMQKASKHFAIKTFTKVQESDFVDHYNFYVVGGAIKLFISLKKNPDEYQNFHGIVRSKIADQPFSLAADGIDKLTIKQIIKAIKKKFVGLIDMSFFEATSNKKECLPLALLDFDQKLKIQNYKVGVILIPKSGSKSRQELFENTETSELFQEFLANLGSKITLKGWRGYRGDLDTTSNTDGTNAYYTTWNDLEIMFHVSTLLSPNSRDRLLDNDIVTIVFQESPEWDPNFLESRVGHVQIIIHPIAGSEKTSYRITILNKDGVPKHLPSLESGNLFQQGFAFREWLLHKIVNSERAAWHCTSTLQRQQFSYLEHLYTTRDTFLNAIINNCDLSEVKKTKKKLMAVKTQGFSKLGLKTKASGDKFKTEKQNKEKRDSLTPENGGNMKRIPSINDLTSLDWTERTKQLLDKPSSELKLAAQLPGLAKLSKVEGTQITTDFKESDELLSLFIEIGSRIESRDYVAKIIENYHMFVTKFGEEKEMEDGIQRFLDEVIGDDSKTAKVLKFCTYDMMAPAIEHLSIATSNLPYKDIEKATFTILANKDEDITIRFLKKQKAINTKEDAELEFDWILEGKFDPEMTDVELKIYVNRLEFGKSFAPVEEAKLRSRFRPFLVEEIAEKIIFGSPLNKTEVMEGCISMLSEKGLLVEGLFRISPPSSSVSKIKNQYDRGESPDLKEFDDAHLVAGVLRLFLRELPEPILTCELYQNIAQISQYEEHKTAAIEQFLDALPELNKSMAVKLFELFAKIASNSDVNLMTSANIANCLTQSLIHKEDQDLEQSAIDIPKLTTAVKYLIEYSQQNKLNVN